MDEFSPDTGVTLDLNLLSDIRSKVLYPLLVRNPGSPTDSPLQVILRPITWVIHSDSLCKIHRLFLYVSFLFCRFPVEEEGGSVLRVVVVGVVFPESNPVRRRVGWILTV